MSKRATSTFYYDSIDLTDQEEDGVPWMDLRKLSSAEGVSHVDLHSSDSDSPNVDTSGADLIDQIDELIAWVSEMSAATVLSSPYPPTELPSSIPGKHISPQPSSNLKPLPPLPLQLRRSSSSSPPLSPPPAIETKPSFLETISSWSIPKSPTVSNKIDQSCLVTSKSPIPTPSHVPGPEADSDSDFELPAPDQPPFSDTAQHLLACIRTRERPLTTAELGRFSPRLRDMHDAYFRMRDVRIAAVAKAERDARFRREMEAGADEEEEAEMDWLTSKGNHARLARRILRDIQRDSLRDMSGHMPPAGCP